MERQIVQVGLFVFFDFFVGPDAAFVHAGTFGGAFVPGLFICKHPGPERVGGALYGSGFVCGAAFIPQNTVVIFLFLESQNLSAVIIVGPAAVF